MDLPVLTKLYYSIGEVADIFGVAPSMIRYWESEFQQLKPGKNSKGDRKYTARDIEMIHLIFTLVKVRGFTIEGARKELDIYKQESKKTQIIVTRLKSLRKKVSDLKSLLD
jgi:DNA-binding transcriptional MerR regulator